MVDVWRASDVIAAAWATRRRRAAAPPAPAPWTRRRARAAAGRRGAPATPAADAFWGMRVALMTRHGIYLLVEEAGGDVVQAPQLGLVAHDRVVEVRRARDAARARHHVPAAH